MIGYWDGPAVPEGLPDVCGFVGAADDPARPATAAYLRSGTVFAVSAGFSVCRLCGRANGSALLTDGEHFVWPDGLAHYVEDHGVRLPDEVVAVAARGAAAAADLDEFDGSRIDAQWWCRQTGRPDAAHLPGCRRSARVASWDLPDRAEIYVDRVPPDAVAVLAGIRRLLGTAWPFSQLRARLGTQPFRALSGSPRQLYHALSAVPELRPYLFYDSDGTLMPVDERR